MGEEGGEGKNDGGRGKDGNMRWGTRVGEGGEIGKG